MSYTTTSRVNQLLGEVTLAPFSLQEDERFPHSDWTERKTLYEEWEQWFDGTKLEEKQNQGGKAVDKYPVKINPIRGAVFKHAYALFGEFASDSRPLVPPILKPDDMALKDDAQIAQNFLNAVWSESFGRTIQMRNAMLSQVFGGCAFKVSYVPRQTWRRYPIRIESVHPANFIGIPMAGDEYRLQEAWIIKTISEQEAVDYGVPIRQSEDGYIYFVEHWLPDNYEISINGVAIPKPEGDGETYAGENPFGVVPIVYIPHIRVSGFWGESLISKNIEGIVEELNKRVADVGDAVSADSHKYYKLINSMGLPEVVEIAPGIRALVIKSNPAITGKEQQAEFDEIGGNSSTQAMADLTTELYNHFRREAFVPAVADGEDEGSQRSGQTLAMRMWPLLSHTSTERVFWGDGLGLVDYMILKIALLKKIGNLPKSVKEMRIERRWPPILPRDREAFIAELVNRAGSKLGSQTHLLSLIDDIEDPKGEFEEIKKNAQEMAEIQAKTIAEGIVAKQSQSNAKPGTQGKSNTQDKGATKK
jgi:hypothetical protein